LMILFTEEVKSTVYVSIKLRVMNYLVN